MSDSDSYLDDRIDSFISMVMSKKFDKYEYGTGMGAISNKYNDLKDTPEYSRFLSLAREYDVDSENRKQISPKLVSAYEDLSDRMYESTGTSSSGQTIDEIGMGNIGAVAAASKGGSSGGAATGKSVPTLLHSDPGGKNKASAFENMMFAVVTIFLNSLKTKFPDYVGSDTSATIMSAFKSQVTSGTDKDPKATMTGTVAIPLNVAQSAAIQKDSAAIIAILAESPGMPNDKAKYLFTDGTVTLAVTGEISTKPGGKFFNKAGTIDLDATATFTLEETAQAPPAQNQSKISKKGTIMVENNNSNKTTLLDVMEDDGALDGYSIVDIGTDWVLAYEKGTRKALFAYVPTKNWADASDGYMCFDLLSHVGSTYQKGFTNILKKNGVKIKLYDKGNDYYDMIVSAEEKDESIQDQSQENFPLDESINRIFDSL